MTGQEAPQENTDAALLALQQTVQELERRIAEAEAWLEELSGDVLDRTA